MCKRFNTAGLCYREEHYMVDMKGRLEETKALIDRGEYFVINRARQYGKTTMLHLLAENLSADYAVFSISFEGIEDGAYETSEKFCRRLCRLLYRYLVYHTVSGIPDSLKNELRQMQSGKMDMEDLSDFISELCDRSEKPVVLMVDEVDQAGNHKLFLTFLGMLRRKYLLKQSEPTFYSVVLAGVYDIKNMKLKVRTEEEHQYNSPWNIASDYMVDMNFSVADIASMLMEYETDVHTSMDVSAIAELIYDFTSGYPFLVSRLCKIIDEKIPGKESFPDLMSAWTREGVLESVKILLMESNTLFDDMIKKLDDSPILKQALMRILFKGERIPYNKERNYFVHDGMLDMERVLERFVESFTDIYYDADKSFVEENGRRFFLLYLKPIINGVGNFYVEARTRNMRRTDIVIDYRGQQFVCELKIWHGKEYNTRGEDQLMDYLDSYHLTTGYMLSFNFNKNKQIGVRRIQLGEKLLIEAVV